MHNKTLKNTVLALLLVMCLAMFMIFMHSLKPSAQTKAQQVSVAMPNLEPGSFAYIPHPVRDSRRPSHLLFVRSLKGELLVYDIPSQGAQYIMPDRQWFRPGHACNSFVPNFITYEFECHNPALLQSVKDQLRWRLTGESVFPLIYENIPKVDGIVEANQFTLFGY